MSELDSDRIIPIKAAKTKNGELIPFWLLTYNYDPQFDVEHYYTPTDEYIPLASLLDCLYDIKSKRVFLGQLVEYKPTPIFFQGEEVITLNYSQPRNTAIKDVVEEILFEYTYNDLTFEVGDIGLEYYVPSGFKPTAPIVHVRMYVPVYKLKHTKLKKRANELYKLSD